MGHISSPRSEVEATKWEWRAFWSSATAAPSLDKVLEKKLARCKHRRVADRYLVLETCPDNIKVRNGSLQIKQLFEQHDYFQAYWPKQSFSFPLARHELPAAFPRLPGPERALSTPDEVIAALADSGHRPRCYDVVKDRYKRKVRGVAYEWTKLKIGRSRFWSVAVVGTELNRVASAVATLPGDCTLVGGYTQLLLQLAGLM